MNLEDQVVSLELSRRLKELGVNQPALVYWFDVPEIYHTGGDGNIDHTKTKFKTHLGSPLAWNIDFKDSYAAYTAPELGELLPKFIGEYFYQQIPDLRGHWSCNYINIDGVKFTPYPHMYFTDKNEANHRAKMLIHLLENKLIKLNE